jgi:hypothetical protein
MGSGSDTTQPASVLISSSSARLTIHRLKFLWELAQLSHAIPNGLKSRGLERTSLELFALQHPSWGEARWHSALLTGFRLVAAQTAAVGTFQLSGAGKLNP